MNIHSDHAVLVVDDALTIRSYHKALLEEVGLAVVEAENGVEALERLVEQPLSLCLVDVNMPLMDGYSFVSQLRQSERNADCPVIMITTESRACEEERGYEAGANLYLVKPADRDLLQAFCALMISPKPEGEGDSSELPEQPFTDELALTPLQSAASSGLHDYFNELMSE